MMKVRFFNSWVHLVCLLCSIVLVPASYAAEELVDFDITGSWASEPQLGQLGFVQVSYTFGQDGTFSQKADFKSFCGMGAVTPDCDYFWNVSQGKYSLNGSVLKLHHEKANSHLKYQGKAEPVLRDMQMQPMTEEMQLGVDQGKLVFTNKKGKTQVFSPVPASD